MKKALPFTLVLLLLLGGGATLLWKNDSGAPEEAVPAATLEQGIELFDQKKYPEALAALQALTAAGSENWRAWYYLGSTQMMLKDYPAAAEALERSLALRPQDPGTLYALGVAYYRQGNLKLAKAYFGAVLEINPNDQHARGLMDIMSRLEQNSANATEEAEPAPAEGSGTGL